MESVDDKLDDLLVHTTRLASRQDAMLARMDAVEQKASKVEKFVDNCTLGRRVILQAISGLGALAALVLAAWAAWKS